MGNDKTIKKLKAAGLLKEKYNDYVKLYNEFKGQYKETQSKMQAYTNTSEKMGASEVTVQRAVKAIGSL